MELFLRIPHEKREADGSPVRMALLDLKGAVTYLIRENTCLFKLLIVVAGINLFLSALDVYKRQSLRSLITVRELKNRT